MKKNIDNSLLVFRDVNFKDKSFVIYYWHDMKTANGINSYLTFLYAQSVQFNCKK